jgi:CheY-like chemotaxis protein
MSQSTALKKSYTIMIVEDDPGVAAMLETMLRDHFKCNTVVTTNGLDALAITFENVPDLILADLHLPVLDGFEIIHCLKKHPVLNIVPIVALSNYPWDFDWEQRALEAGCDRCSHKQFSVAEMGDLLREMLEPEGSGRAWRIAAKK